MAEFRMAAGSIYRSDSIRIKASHFNIQKWFPSAGMTADAEFRAWMTFNSAPVVGGQITGKFFCICSQ
jgi:hypothetical protein